MASPRTSSPSAEQYVTEVTLRPSPGRPAGVDDREHKGVSPWRWLRSPAIGRLGAWSRRLVIVSRIEDEFAAAISPVVAETLLLRPLSPTMER